MNKITISIDPESPLSEELAECSPGEEKSFLITVSVDKNDGKTFSGELTDLQYSPGDESEMEEPVEEEAVDEKKYSKTPKAVSVLGAK